MAHPRRRRRDEWAVHASTLVCAALLALPGGTHGLTATRPHPRVGGDGSPRHGTRAAELAAAEVGGVVAEDDGMSSLPSEWSSKEFVVLSERPRIFYFPHFLDDDAVARILDTAEGKYTMGLLDGAKANANVRNSATHFMTCEDMQDPALRTIQRRAQEVTMLPLEHFEGLQVQKYEAVANSSNGQAQFYRPHLDSISGGSRRVATFVYFLSDVEEGGETFFPLVPSNGSRRTGRDQFHDHATALARGMDRWEALCAAPADEAKFLKVTPRKGAAVLFYSLTPGGETDWLTVHGGCPVVRGTKVISQQWIRENPMYQPFEAASFEGFWYRLAGSDPAADVSAGCANQPHARRTLRPLPARGAGTAADNDSRVRRLTPEWASRAWCTDPAAEAAAPLLRQVEDSHAFTLSFHVHEADCDKANNLEVTVHAPGAGCCAWTVRMSHCRVTVEGPSTSEHFRELLDDPLDLSDRLSRHKAGMVSLVLQDMADFDGTGPRDPATGAPAAADRQLLNFTNWLVLDGTGAGRRYSGVAPLAGVDWEQSQLCVALGPATEITNLMLLSSQATTREMGHLRFVALSANGQAARPPSPRT